MITTIIVLVVLVAVAVGGALIYRKNGAKLEQTAKEVSDAFKKL